MPHVDRDAPYVTQTLPPAVSAEERAEIRELHVQCEAFSGLIICEECMDDWPCPVIRALDALEAAETALAAAEAREDALQRAWRRFGRHNGPTSQALAECGPAIEAAEVAIVAAHDARKEATDV